MKCRYVKFYYGEECEYIYCFDQNMDDDKILTEYKVAVKIALLRRKWNEGDKYVKCLLMEIVEDIHSILEKELGWKNIAKQNVYEARLGTIRFGVAFKPEDWEEQHDMTTLEKVIDNVVCSFEKPCLLVKQIKEKLKKDKILNMEGEELHDHEKIYPGQNIRDEEGHVWRVTFTADGFLNVVEEHMRR